MKMYEVTYTDPERGLCRHWLRNKRQVVRFVEQIERDDNLREHVLTAQREIPTDNKQAFVEWLNANATRRAI